MARLIVFAGLPAAGKSTIARQLATRLGAMWVRIDSMDEAIWASGTAPADLRDWTYRAAQALAADNLALGRDVIADGVNGWKGAQQGWEQAANRAGATLVWLNILCSDALEHQRRVETRISDIPGLALPSWEAVSAREHIPGKGVSIDTAHRPVADCVAAVLAALGG